jgi:hypothetical protein
MSATELKNTLNHLGNKIKSKSGVHFKTMSNISPPKIKNVLVPKLTTVASIPHRTKGAPYVEQQKKLLEE